MRRSVGACFRAALGWWAALAIVRARELDPAACSARFDVQRDKIIRTEESREMGARYLSELDVGTRHECLRLCCETDSCDVFVYEEKSPGSCYLFNCGPPEDFRCKFTAHGNFSSGVLALSRRLAELQDQERLAHHEQELANLRGATSTTAAPTTPATATPAPPPAPPRPPDQPQAGRCSRYQFECRRGGECIAVYNACDGVPQCADGSDEAPELGCPAPAPPPAAPRPAPPPAPPPPAPAPAPRHHQRPPPTPEPEPPTHPPPQIKTMQMLGDPVEGEGSREAGEERWPWPHRLAQAQPPPPPPPHRYNVAAAAAEVSRGSHIFAHKGGLLQEAEGAPPQYAPFDAPSPWARRLWPQPQPQTGVEWGAAGGWGDTDPRRAWPVPPAPRQEMPVYAPPKTMPELPVEYAGAPPPMRDAAKKGPPAPAPAPAPAPPSPAPRPPPAPAPPAHNHDHEKEHNHEPGAIAGDGAGAGAAPLAADERDGLSDHPPAAILLLVLGVAMTAVLGGLVGCRARAARRRMRRGKSPLAHDADYLVNGMYL